MKKIVTPLLLVLGVIILASCRNDFEFEPSSGNLGFSRDTVFLDTVFSNIGSSTRSFKVYNNSDKDIVIPRVALEEGENSLYRLAVDGIAGKVFQNVELLANDSLFVFVETTVDIATRSNDLEFLYEDKILFDSGILEQSVQLVTLVKDAVFLFPERDDQGIPECLVIGMNPDGEEICIEGFLLEDDELLFTNEKPYVIYGFAAIPNDKIMVVEAGARLFFHDGSGLIAANEATLKVNGAPSLTEDLENQVIFQGDRLEPSFNEVAGQWSTIWLTDGSKNHEISYATIKNASVGILMDNSNPASNGATLKIDNTQIYNSANVGLLGTTAHIEAENLVITNSGQSSLVARLGGEYRFNNCTIANYWNESFREDPALFISNSIPRTDLSEDLIEATFTNCIIYGDRDLELLIFESEASSLNFKFENSLLKFNDRFNELDDDVNYNFQDPGLYFNTVLNVDPEFENVDRNFMRILNFSGAGQIGNAATATNLDILGILRSTPPDAGAYEGVDSFE
ncbi:MAG: hypothetical protein WBA16_07155 [Nonlabens sp.]